MGIIKSSSSSLKNTRKIFNNRIRGLEKKFYELRTLCNVEAAVIVNSGYLRNGVGLLPENSDEFHEVLRRYQMYGNKKKKGEFIKECPKIDKLSVQSLSGIERDLESMFVMIAEKENQLKGVISSSSCSIRYCDQDEKKKSFGVSDSTCLIESSNNAYASSSSSSDFNQVPQELITLPTAADDMNEMEFQRWNCSSYMMEMMNTTSSIDGPEHLLY